MNIKGLNEFYKSLEDRANQITSTLSKIHGEFKFTTAYYGGHYYKNQAQEYEIAYYPIPVISVKNICDIEINVNNISISTKLTRDRALIFNYDLLSKYDFEVYGVEDYLSSYYRKGLSFEHLIDNIKSSDEKEICFAFEFSKDSNCDIILDIVRFLCFNGFYY